MPATISKNLKVGFTTLLVLVFLDAVWLTTTAVHLYRSTVPDLLRPEPNLPAAAAFYLVYAAGIVALCVRPDRDAGSLFGAARLGAILGFTAYATFALTNLSVMRGWTPSLALIDMSWGTVLTAISAAAAYKADQIFSRKSAS
jgi:uncharacterized membrane protein